MRPYRLTVSKHYAESTSLSVVVSYLCRVAPMRIMIISLDAKSYAVMWYAVTYYHCINMIRALDTIRRYDTPRWYRCGPSIRYLTIYLPLRAKIGSRSFLWNPALSSSSSAHEVAGHRPPPKCGGWWVRRQNSLVSWSTVNADSHRDGSGVASTFSLK